MYKIQWNKLKWNRIDKRKRLRILLFACGTVCIIGVCMAIYLRALNQSPSKTRITYAYRGQNIEAYLSISDERAAKDIIASKEKVWGVAPGEFGKELSLILEDATESVYISKDGNATLFNPDKNQYYRVSKECMDELHSILMKYGWRQE